jgi:hypothetical protein
MKPGKGKALIAILGAGKPSDEDEEEAPPSSRPGARPSREQVKLAEKMQMADENEDAEALAHCLKAFVYNCIDEYESMEHEDEESPDSEKY